MSFDFIRTDIDEQKAKSRYRQLVCTSTASQGNEIIINGKSYLNFSSNDYLGLNNHAQINKALQDGVDKFGTCSSSSSLVTGYH